MAATALLLAILGPLGVLLWSLRRFEGIETALRSSPDLSSVEEAIAQLRQVAQTHDDELEQLQEAVRDQTLAIAEGIERVDRAERRVRAAVGRARRRMEELGYVDEGLEAEAAELRELDADGGNEEGVYAMPGYVGGPPARDMSAFPGVWD